MTKEALKLALEALEEHEYGVAQIIIREALAQPEQEPVAWVVYSSAENDIVWADKGKRLKQNTPLYTTPPQRKPLTDEEIDELSRSMVKGDKSVNWLCRAIEAAHGIKE